MSQPTSTEKRSNISERKQEMSRNLEWAYQQSSTCNCQSCQYIRAYNHDLQELLTNE